MSIQIVAGGVIIDSAGDWIGGFAVNLGKGQTLEVVVSGLLFGLKLTSDGFDLLSQFSLLKIQREECSS